jgi:hypothetical protein
MEMEYSPRAITASPSKKRQNSESTEGSPTKRLRTNLLQNNINSSEHNVYIGGSITSEPIRRQLFSDSISDLGSEIKKWINKVCKIYNILLHN